MLRILCLVIAAREAAGFAICKPATWTAALRSPVSDGETSQLVSMRSTVADSESSQQVEIKLAAPAAAAFVGDALREERQGQGGHGRQTAHHQTRPRPEPHRRRLAGHRRARQDRRPAPQAEDDIYRCFIHDAVVGRGAGAAARWT